MCIDKDGGGYEFSCKSEGKDALLRDELSVERSEGRMKAIGRYRTIT